MGAFPTMKFCDFCGEKLSLEMDHISQINDR